MADLNTPRAAPSDLPEDFMIVSLEIESLKGVRELALTFESDVTVIAGENGVGKTTILEAIRRYAGTFRYIDENDVPVRAHVGVRGARHRKMGMRTIPRIFMYGEDRARRVESSATSDTEAYASPYQFRGWWETRDIHEAREIRRQKDFGFRDPELGRFRAALKKTEAFRNAEVSPENGLTLVWHDRKVLWGDLSAGERTIFALIGDLAVRSGSLMVDGEEEPSAVVLIDEIELHLHPKWQRTIIPTLRKAFPHFQFIVTTHSPQVIGSVEARCVRLLRRGEGGQTIVRIPSATKGLDSNFILEEMDADERSVDAERAIDAFRDCLAVQDWVGAKSKMNDLEAAMDDASTILPRLALQLDLARRRAGG